MNRVLAGCLVGAALWLFGVATWTALVRDPMARRSGAAVQARLLTEREQAYQWIREHTLPGDRVAAWKDVVLYLYTGRQSLRPIATLPQAFYMEDIASEGLDLASICDAPRHVAARYWMTSAEDFNLVPHRERFLARMEEIGTALPVAFHSSSGSVDVHDSSCLNSAQRPECRGIAASLFAK